MSDLEELKRLHDNATQGALSQGITLLTRQTERWTDDQIAASNAQERLNVFVNFDDRDAGRSRQLVATFTRPEDAQWIAAIHNAFPAILARLEAAQRLRDAAKTAPDILEHMIMTSENGKCPPLHYLLTHEGLYGFHMANLWVRNDGKEYTISADWADNCGRLVKHLTEALAAFDKEQTE